MERNKTETMSKLREGGSIQTGNSTIPSLYFYLRSRIGALLKQVRKTRREAMRKTRVKKKSGGKNSPNLACEQHKTNSTR